MTWAPHYRKDAPPIVLLAADRITTIHVHKRRDGWWQWTKYRSGRKVATTGEGLQRCRALAQARREMGLGRWIERVGPDGQTSRVS